MRIKWNIVRLLFYSVPSFSLFLSAAPATADETLQPEMEWVLQFGTRYSAATAVAVSPKGGIYVAGYLKGTLPEQSSPGLLHEAFVRNYDSDGKEIWTRQFGASNSDFATDVAVGPKGEVYVAGYVSTNIGGQAPHGWKRHRSWWEKIN
jgi:hypothetical protein